MPCNLAAQKSFVAIQGGSHNIDILAAQRHHIDCCQAQVGGHAHFRDGYHMAFDHGIMHFAASKQVGEHVPHQLAHPQLPLGEPWVGLHSMMAGHQRVRCTVSVRKHSITSPTRMSW